MLWWPFPFIVRKKKKRKKKKKKPSKLHIRRGLSENLKNQIIFNKFFQRNFVKSSFFCDSDVSATLLWRQIKGYWYVFDKIKGYWYVFDKIKGYWYVFDKIKGYWYVFDINGQKRPIHIHWYQNYKNHKLYSENVLKKEVVTTPSVDVLQRNRKYTYSNSSWW